MFAGYLISFPPHPPAQTDTYTFPFLVFPAFL